MAKGKYAKRAVNRDEQRRQDAAARQASEQAELHARLVAARQSRSELLVRLAGVAGAVQDLQRIEQPALDAEALAREAAADEKSARQYATRWLYAFEDDRPEVFHGRGNDHQVNAAPVEASCALAAVGIHGRIIDERYALQLEIKSGRYRTDPSDRVSTREMFPHILEYVDEVRAEVTAAVDATLAVDHHPHSA